MRYLIRDVISHFASAIIWVQQVSVNDIFLFENLKTKKIWRNLYRNLNPVSGLEVDFVEC